MEKLIAAIINAAIVSVFKDVLWHLGPIGQLAVIASYAAPVLVLFG